MVFAVACLTRGGLFWGVNEPKRKMVHNFTMLFTEEMVHIAAF